jgi:hypothetical protein
MSFKFWQQPGPGSNQQAAGYGSVNQSPYGSPMQPGVQGGNVVSTATASSSAGAVVNSQDEIVVCTSSVLKCLLLSVQCVSLITLPLNAIVVVAVTEKYNLW